MPTGHAKLSPSAAHRWMNCPGSVRLIGDDSGTTTQAAMLGTAAHKIVELMVTNDQHDAREYHRYSCLVKAAGDEDVEVYPPGTPVNLDREGWFLFICDDKMVDGVQCTIDEVDRIREGMFQPEVFPERYFDGSWLDPRFGGTGDVTVVELFGWAHLVDHKNGTILVEIEHDGKPNEQLLNYAVFILHEHPEIEGVHITISQPNGYHIMGPIRTASYTRAEILEFQAKMVEAAKETDKPNALLRAGDWCTFCAAKTRCKEFDDAAIREALDDFSTADDPPPDLAVLNVPSDTTELARKGKWVPLIEGWCKQIMSSIQQELENGNDVEGYKLVRGRSNRKWIAEESDPKGIVNEFVALGIEESACYGEPKLKSPAQIEKLVKGRGKDAKTARELLKAKVKELAFNPPGGVSVARANEPGEAITAFADAASEFDDSDTDDFGP